MENENITITKAEHNSLLRDRCKLYALEGAGVDNWQGYDEIWDYYEELLKGYGLSDD